ncbi:MAG: sugar phosphate isomerase/epimerase [Candidatus Latescibacteria bacterium]|nr:sugar phosphate isomerase/epimerase [Candidatus Latescibacterota bacterium]
MRVALSVRIAESPGSKEQTTRTLAQLAALAAGIGYQAVCMRASQVGIQTPLQDITAARHTVQGYGLTVSMVTGDVAIPLNNDRAPEALRHITPYLDLAALLESDLIRVGMKHDTEIVWAQRAADEARERGIRLAHQSHTLSLFETVAGSLDVLRRINRPNFGLIYEPANLDLCGQDYGPETITRFEPWLFNVYLQNHRKTPDGRVTLATWSQGAVSYDPIRLQDSGGLDFPMILDTLDRIGYTGYVTVHQAFTELMEPEDAARQSYDHLTRIGHVEPLKGGGQGHQA